MYHLVFDLVARGPIPPTSFWAARAAPTAAPAPMTPLLVLYSIRQDTSEYVRIRQNTSEYVRIRQHMSMRQLYVYVYI